MRNGTFERSYLDTVALVGIIVRIESKQVQIVKRKVYLAGWMIGLLA
jgi:hypothetical protein